MKKAIDALAISGTTNGAWVRVPGKEFSLQVDVVTSTLSGNFTVEIANEQTNGTQMVWSDGTTNIAATGAAQHFHRDIKTDFAWYRIVFTGTGTGTVNGYTNVNR